ncbi:MAG: hypothetical protein LJE97_10610 [Betaproteobacteria bacterium]|nr:hypothetical protein [Betaproteobacteria bacterium]
MSHDIPAKSRLLPTIPVTSPQFVYRRARETDVRITFARARVGGATTTFARARVGGTTTRPALTIASTRAGTDVDPEAK